MMGRRNLPCSADGKAKGGAPEIAFAWRESWPSLCARSSLNRARTATAGHGLDGVDLSHLVAGEKTLPFWERSSLSNSFSMSAV